MVTLPTPDEIRAVIAQHLAENRGKTAAHWSALIAIEKTNIVFDIHCNWRAIASGTKAERAAIDEVADAMRGLVAYLG